jgi:hypothetical protein
MRTKTVQETGQNYSKHVYENYGCLSKPMEEKEISSSSVSGQSSRSTNSLVGLAQVIVANKAFDWMITGVILLQAMVLALEATPDLHYFGREGELTEARIFTLIHNLVIAVFIVEAALRLCARYPRPQSYFKDGWNCFDFAIILLSLMPIAGEFSTVARLVRLLRITRLITKSTELRAIVSTLVRSIPSIFNILILLHIRNCRIPSFQECRSPSLVIISNLSDHTISNHYIGRMGGCNGADNV